jgi:hypothetical protein
MERADLQQMRKGGVADQYTWAWQYRVHPCVEKVRAGIGEVGRDAVRRFHRPIPVERNASAGTSTHIQYRVEHADTYLTGTDGTPTSVRRARGALLTI